MDSFNMKIFFSIFGLLLIALLANWFAREQAKKNAKQDAGNQLLKALSPELSKLCPTKNLYPEEMSKILCDSFLRHRKAMVEFGYFLSAKEKKEYLEKCNNYFEQGGNSCLFKRYETEEGIKLFHNDIESILEHVGHNQSLEADD